MRKAAFLIMLSFCLAAFGQQADMKVRFFKPNYGWAVEMPFRGFSIVDADQYDGSNIKVTAADEKRGIIVEIYFEPGAPGSDHKKVRSFYESNLARAKTPMENISKWETASAAFMTYTAKKVLLNPPGDELNGDMYFCKGSTWVDVRFRKSYPEAGDEKKIADLLRSVRFIGGFEPSPQDNIFMGNLYCYSGFGDNCLSCLGKAFETEKKTPGLSKELRIVLCQNYGEALRMKGERGKAMEVLNYGLAHDPTYPMYYWVKARMFADLGDEDSTVEMLQAAVINRQYLLPGEKFPDPRQEEAFKVLGMKESFKVRVTKIFMPEEAPPDQKDTGK